MHRSIAILASALAVIVVAVRVIADGPNLAFVSKLPSACAEGGCRISMVDDHLGRLYHRTTLWETIDGGAHWQERPLPAKPTIGAITVEFTDKLRAWSLVPHPRGLFETSDGGATWASKGIPALDGVMIGSWEATDGTAWLAGGRYKPSSTPGPNYATKKGPSGWMVLHPVVFTRKAANPWQEHELPAPSHQITHVRFWDANRGYAIGDESFYATEDGGQHWQTGKFHLQEKTLSEYPHEGENPAVFFLDSHDGWMSLQEPHHWAIYRTKDGGKEWRRIGTNDGWSFDKILFVSQTHGFGVGHSFQETVDGGVHWQPIETSFEVQDVFFLSPESGFLVSSRELYRIDIR